MNPLVRDLIESLQLRVDTIQETVEELRGTIETITEENRVLRELLEATASALTKLRSKDDLLS